MGRWRGVWWLSYQRHVWWCVIAPFLPCCGVVPVLCGTCMCLVWCMHVSSVVHACVLCGACMCLVAHRVMLLCAPYAAHVMLPILCCAHHPLLRRPVVWIMRRCCACGRPRRHVSRGFGLGLKHEGLSLWKLSRCNKELRRCNKAMQKGDATRMQQGADATRS